LKTQVGELIYEYVKTMVPQERAPKITGMLIELPVDQIKAYLVSYDALNQKVQEASDLIDQSEGGAAQQAPQ